MATSNFESPQVNVRKVEFEENIFSKRDVSDIVS